MSDIIHLLPDSVANQIAAGEVIQRPASVIKELVENSVDAGATEIKVIVKDAGKTLIQVVDNGRGMSETDARLAFERHATSKIRSADDLFNIFTKGFRGEALASIASISHVTLKTKLSEEECGTQIDLSGSVIENQSPVSCPAGSNFIIKDLFYNVPARRKFLKSNTTEFKHILNEFERIVLAHPDIEFSLINNEEVALHLPQTNLRQRIIHVFGKQMNQNLANLDNETTIASISGFVGKPEFAKRTSGEQFFFINQRYMRHPYFHRAVMKAYENILPTDQFASYFIYIMANPQTIDVNIHPTKTEIKFENEQALFQILNAAVKEALGKSNVVPSIDFDTHGVVEIPVMTKDTRFKAPEIPINYSFNPFTEESKTPNTKQTFTDDYYKKNQVPNNWEMLYSEEKEIQNKDQQEFFPENEEITEVSRTITEYLQIKGKYIITPVKSGMMIIDQRKAHIRVLFEFFVRNMAMNQTVSQRLLFPEKIDLNNEDYLLVREILEELNGIGFDLSDLGGNTIVVNGIPETGQVISTVHLIEQMIEEYKITESALKISLKEKIAFALAKASAIPYGKNLGAEEMQHLVDELFACENPNYTPNGKKTLGLMNLNEFEKFIN